MTGKFLCRVRRAALLFSLGAAVAVVPAAHADVPYPGDDATYVDELGDTWPGPDAQDEASDSEPGQLSPPAPRGFDYRALERAVHREMNAMRQDPAAYADKIAARRGTYRGKIRQPRGGQAIQTTEGVAALDEAVEVLRGQGRLPLLAWSEPLHTSANGHAMDLNRNNLVGHTGSNGSQLGTRVGRVGKVEGWTAENIAFGPRTGEDVVIGLIVDDGVADRGHRDVLLKPDLFVAGTGCGPHPTYGVTCVINYATRLTPAGGQPSSVAAAPGPSYEDPAAYADPNGYEDPGYDATGDEDPAAGWDARDDAQDAQGPSGVAPGYDAAGYDNADDWDAADDARGGQGPSGVAPVWGPPVDLGPGADARADAGPTFEDLDTDAGPDDSAYPYPTQEPRVSANRQPAPNYEARAPQRPLQQLFDDRYPADHQRNQPPDRRQVRRPIMQTEGGHGSRGESQYRAPRGRTLPSRARPDYRY